MVNNTIDTTHTQAYKLTIIYKEMGVDQSEDMNKTFSAKVNIVDLNAVARNNPYEDNKNSLAYNIINNAMNKTNETELVGTPKTIPLEEISTADEKELSIVSDDYGTSYYFRGAVEDNYVNYAGMCWRIVRIQGDGSIKLILSSELSCSDTNMTTSSGYATDGAAGVQRTILTANYGYKNVVVGNNTYKINDYINSAADTIENTRTKLNTWLERKITSESDKALLKNETWCIGDQTHGYSYDDTGEVVGTVSNLINSGISFEFTAGNKYFVTETPSYRCETTGIDGEVDINKVGMLTFDEIAFAGGTSSKNSTYYLNKNATTNYWWALSPSHFHIGDSRVYSFRVNRNVPLHSNGVENTCSLRVAVSLTSSTKITSGDGTVNNAYAVE